MKTWKRCPYARCENGDVFDRGLLRFVSCDVCGGHGVVEGKPGFFDALHWSDMIYPAVCVLVIVGWWWLV